MRLTGTEIGQILHLPVNDANLEISGIVIDSREATPGSLFVCLPGKNTDGNKFARDACENGACAILTSCPQELDSPVFVVDDPVAAMGALAAYARDRSKAKVIAVTGTAGKTTLKETLKAIFSVSGKILATEKNHNNQIGLPLSIFKTDGSEDYWILEAGISHPGDMDELGAIIRPDMAVILNIGPGHTEGLGDRGVAWNKARLLEYLRPGGTALVSMDYPALRDEVLKIVPRPYFFSLKNNDEADFCVLRANHLDGEYEIRLRDTNLICQTPFRGEWGSEIILAASAAAWLNGVGKEDILRGISQLEMPEQRFSRHRLGGWQVIDDSYNANPLSMKRMIESVASLAQNAGLPLYLALGEMGELGAESKEQHEELGKLVASFKPEAVFWKGEYAAQIMAPLPAFTRFYHLKEALDFKNAMDLELAANSGGVILVKGSRANHLENLVAEIKRLHNNHVF